MFFTGRKELWNILVGMNGLCLEGRKGVKWDSLVGRGDIVRLLLKKKGICGRKGVICHSKKMGFGEEREN